MKCRLSSVYDVHHCNNHMFANRVIHPLWFWIRANLPEEYIVQLKTILEKQSTRFRYHPPFKEAIGKRDWSPSNIVTNDFLKEDSFWKALADLFPGTANGLTVKQNGEVLQDPIHRCLKLMQILIVQLNSWSPEGVDQRDDMCHEAHQLFWDLGLPLRWFGVRIHFFWSTTPPGCANLAPSWACHRRGASMSTSPTPRLCKDAPLAHEGNAQWGWWRS